MKPTYLFFICFFAVLCNACYAQKTSNFYVEYAPEHMKKNKNQTVEKMFLSFKKMSLIEARELGRENIKAIVTINAKFKMYSNWYSNNAFCYPNKNFSQSWRCYIDGDEGGFTIKLDKSKAVLSVEHLMLLQCGVSEEKIRNGEIDNGIIGLNTDKGADDIFKISSVSNKQTNKIKAINCTDTL